MWGQETEQKRRMGKADVERMWVANESEGAQLEIWWRSSESGFIVVEAQESVWAIGPQTQAQWRLLPLTAGE